MVASNLATLSVRLSILACCSLTVVAVATTLSFILMTVVSVSKILSVSAILNLLALALHRYVGSIPGRIVMRRPGLR